MKKLLLMMALTLPVVVSAQEEGFPNELSTAQMYAMGATMECLPQRNGVRFIVSDGDTVWSKWNNREFYYALCERMKADNTVKEVCGVPFGCSYKDAESALLKIFGVPAYASRNNILYKDVRWAGRNFDTLLLNFQDKGDDSRLWRADLLVRTGNAKETMIVKRQIQNEYRNKYPLLHIVNDNLSAGGLSPVNGRAKSPEEGVTMNELGFGFEIRVPEDDPCSIQVRYGPYNYQ